MRERLRRFLRRYRLAIAIPLAFITMWVALWNIPPTHAAIMTGLVTQELMLDLPVSPLNLLGAGVVHEEVALDVPQGRGQLVGAFQAQHSDIGFRIHPDAVASEQPAITR